MSHNSRLCYSGKLNRGRYLTNFIVETHNNETDRVRAREKSIKEVRSGKRHVTQTDNNAQCFKIMSINQSYWQFGANNSVVVCVCICVCSWLCQGCYGDDSPSGGSWPVPAWLSSAGCDVTCLSLSSPDTGNQAGGYLSVWQKVHQCLCTVHLSGAAVQVTNII